MIKILKRKPKEGKKIGIVFNASKVGILAFPIISILLGIVGLLSESDPYAPTSFEFMPFILFSIFIAFPGIIVSVALYFLCGKK